MKAIVVQQHGDPSQLQLQDLPKPEPKSGEVLIKVAESGVNFIDTYHRSGLYKLPTPFTIGQEGSGTVEAVGDDVTNLKVGDRVAWSGNQGSYAEYLVAPAVKVVKLPDGTTFEYGAAAMLQGMTAHYLTHSTFPLKQGDVALIHAAAGGVGLLLVQMAKMRGATVIGTTSTAEKAEKAKAAGADHVILYTEKDFTAESRALTNGKGVHVVYDGVGKSTFAQSIDSLRPRGMMVCFGNASGPVDPVNPLLLSQKGSLFLTRPTLAFYQLTPEELNWRAADVLGWIASGQLHIHIGKTYPLADARLAHQDLESRRTTGKLLLTHS